MSMTTTQTSSHEVANYGGLADAFGGMATVVLAIIGLSGTRPDILLAIATIVFGAALLIQSGAIISELTQIVLPAGSSAVEQFSPGGLSMAFLAGMAAMVLGVLGLIGVHLVALQSIAVIALGSALVFGSNAVWSVQRIKRASMRARAQSGTEILATEMAAGSAGLQVIGGLGAVVLGILAVTGINPTVLSLVGLLVMGGTILLTGSTMSGMVQGFVRPTAEGARSWSESPAE